MNRHGYAVERSYVVEHGYVTVEYVLVVASVTLALIAPIPGLSGESVVDLVMDTIREFQAHSLTMLALP